MEGILNINKPEGFTSYDVIRVIKKNFDLRGKKIGHAGTLDPLAEGVLIICIGKATKLAGKFMEFEKEYIAELLLGIKTDTDDIEGEVIEKKEVNVKEEEVKEVIKSFEGEIEQVPPIVSAIKHKGKPLYKLYRKGIIITPPPRKVFIKKIDILKIDFPYVEFRIICSKGTYVRALCRDIGEKLGTGGIQSKLKRIRVGPFKIEDSLTLDELKKKGLENSIIPLKEIEGLLKNGKS